MDYQCMFCFCRAFEKQLQNHVDDNNERLQLAKKFFSLLAKSDTNRPTPVIARDIHAIIRESLGNPDPYATEKRQSNDQALSLYSELKDKVTHAADPFNRALRYALAGNIMDYGPSHSFDISKTIIKLEDAEFAVDHSELLKQSIRTAGDILYLGDNAGEIVFDKLFIETMDHPNVTYAVRGAPVINDATPEDARLVGMDKVATVISNGYDAPSTIPEKAGKEFRQAFVKADLIISKGQGNFEGLMGRDDKRLWFLLMVKCQIIGDKLGVDKGNIVVSNGHESFH